jgi:hypothetical protein
MFLLDPTACPIPATSSWIEWAKIVASTVAGLIAGLIAEPLKSNISNRKEKKDIEHAIKMDFLTLQIGQLAVENGAALAKNYWILLSLPAFESFWATERHLFYPQIHMLLLRVKCENILALKSQVLAGTIQQDNGFSDLKILLKDGMQIKESNWWTKFKNRRENKRRNQNKG